MTIYNIIYQMNNILALNAFLGYMFDFVGSCSCVPYHYQGGPSVGREGLIAGIVILLFLTVTIITAL